MKLYWGACLCLVAAACSRNKPAETPANSGMGPNETTTTLVEADPVRTSASAERDPARTQPMQESRRASPSTSDRAPAGPNTSELPADNQAKSDTAPDNTKVNKRDANGAALTPMDQGNGETDLKITQQIRQAVVGDDSLSFTAKNVKIITVNGKVTLRGPVNTVQERASIEAAARKVAGAAQVDNQLEVKK